MCSPPLQNLQRSGGKLSVREGYLRHLQIQRLRGVTPIQKWGWRVLLSAEKLPQDSEGESLYLMKGCPDFNGEVSEEGAKCTGRDAAVAGGSSRGRGAPH